MQKIKSLYRDKHDEFWELVRYVIAGALTTLLSFLISNILYFVFALDAAAPVPGGSLRILGGWVLNVINSAGPLHTVISNTVSWVLAVLFAFWINRSLVFRVIYTSWRERIVAFFQFTGARVVSFLLFELGMFQLLKLIGVQNFANRLLVLVLVIVFNYVASKFWVFKKNTGSK